MDALKQGFGKPNGRSLGNLTGRKVSKSIYGINDGAMKYKCECSLACKVADLGTLRQIGNARSTDRCIEEGFKTQLLGNFGVFTGKWGVFLKWVVFPAMIKTANWRAT